MSTASQTWMQPLGGHGLAGDGLNLSIDERTRISAHHAHKLVIPIEGRAGIVFPDGRQQLTGSPFLVPAETAQAVWCEGVTVTALFWPHHEALRGWPRGGGAVEPFRGRVAGQLQGLARSWARGPRGADVAPLLAPLRRTIARPLRTGLDRRVEHALRLLTGAADPAVGSMNAEVPPSLRSVPEARARGDRAQTRPISAVPLARPVRPPLLWPMPTLAAAVGLSPSRLRGLFRREVGLPPRRFALWCRVVAAAGLVIGRQRSLAEAALQLGFADQPHFTRAFAQWMGRTPGDLLGR